MSQTFVNANTFGLSVAGEEARQAVLQVLDDGELFRYRSDGRPSWNDQLEREFSAWFGDQPTRFQASAVSSGTAGLTVAMRALGVGPGDHVLVPAFTFVATPMAVVAVGATPEPIDLAANLGLSPDDLVQRLHGKVKAVIGVHVQGHAAELTAASQVLNQQGIPLVEDACQGFGSSCHGVTTGTRGAISVFSFQQAKQLASGEGGMLLTNEAALADACRRLVDLGAVRDANGHPSWDAADAAFGQNLRMTELQAALVVKQLAVATGTIERQRQMRTALREIVEARGVPTVRSADPQGDAGSHLLLAVNDPKTAEAAIHTAAKQSVLIRRVWDRVYYQHGVFARSGLTPQALGVPPASYAEHLAPRLLSVPVPPTLTQEQLGTVADAVVSGVAGGHGTFLG